MTNGLGKHKPEPVKEPAAVATKPEKPESRPESERHENKPKSDETV